LEDWRWEPLAYPHGLGARLLGLTEPADAILGFQEAEHLRHLASEALAIPLSQG